jgi:hypothetical protein
MDQAFSVTKSPLLNNYNIIMDLCYPLFTFLSIKKLFLNLRNFVADFSPSSPIVHLHALNDLSRQSLIRNNINLNT